MAGGSSNHPFPIHPKLTLPIFPPGSNLRFKTPSTLTLSSEDHIILDSLWQSRNLNTYPRILGILAQHLNYKNQEILESSTSQLSLRPYQSPPSLEAYLRLENQKKEKEIQVELLQKELEEVKKKLHIVNQDKNIIEKEYTWESQKNWENDRSSFPPQLTEFKSVILKKWNDHHLQAQIQHQQYFWHLCQNPKDWPKGLALCMTVHHQEKHPEDCCKCFPGFHIFQVSLNLRIFEEQHIENFLQLKFQKLWCYGLLTKVIIEHENDLEIFKNISWRLFSVLTNILRFAHKGFLNLTLNAIPPSITHLPIPVKYWIFVKRYCHASPFQVTNLSDEESFDIAAVGKELSVTENLQLWRNFTLADDMASNMASRWELLLEEPHLKVYGDYAAGMHYSGHPFSSNYNFNPREVDHLKYVEAGKHAIRIGDFQASYVPDPDYNNTLFSEPHSPASMDSIKQHNIENILES